MLEYKHLDKRRDIAIGDSLQSTLEFCIQHLLSAYKEAINDHGYFTIALSGGSTPKSLFQMLTQPPYIDQIDWSKIHLFWSDERSVPSDHQDSNYHMAMTSGFKNTSIPSNQIHRMQAESDITKHAYEYESLLNETLYQGCFDYIMLGMGEDGHTASLFPHTLALNEQQRLVCENFVPQKSTWRMTLTYPMINRSRHIVIYVLGSSKTSMLKKVLEEGHDFHDLPMIQIGTITHKALWICDRDAAKTI